MVAGLAVIAENILFALATIGVLTWLFFRKKAIDFFRKKEEKNAEEK